MPATDRSPAPSPAPETALSSRETRHPVLRIRGLTIVLPGQRVRDHAVDDIDLDVMPGQTVCLVGESGSGKSVTALAAMGLLPRGLAVQSGSIAVRGRRAGAADAGRVDGAPIDAAPVPAAPMDEGPVEIVGARPDRLRALRGPVVGMVFQEPMTALNPVMRCGDQIEEVLVAHGVHRADRVARQRAVRDIIERVGLGDAQRIERSHPHELSGGQRQRILLAMALVLRPSLLIADEPTTALDVTTQARILDLLRELRDERGMGLLFITHDFGVVARMADRIVVMHDGRIVENGPAEQVLADPRHAHTRALIAAVPRGLRASPASMASSHAPGDASTVLSPDATRDAVPDAGPQTPTPPALDLAGLTKRYPSGLLAADDVTLALEAGQTLALIGESGCGKSTVARSIVRLIDPDAGRIMIRGVDFATPSLRALRPHRRLVQIVFQDPHRSLDPRLTVGRSLIEGPMNFGATRTQARQRALALLDRVRLPADAFDRHPHEFSGGQRQRLAIARALAMDPALLVADEAVSALDLTVQAQVLELLDEIQRDTGLAILLITHDLRVAARHADRLAVMRAGRIVEQGATRDVLERPSHRYTRELLAATPRLDAIGVADLTPDRAMRDRAASVCAAPDPPAGQTGG